MMNEKRWLAVHNVQLPAAGRVWGKAFRFGAARFGWEASDGVEFPAQSIVQSGSEFETALADTKEADWLKRGAIAPCDASLHFRLEDVFGKPAADAMRLSNIWTLEDVLADKVGDVLVGETTQRIRASQMLKQLANGNPDLEAMWLDDARRIVNEGRGG